MDNILENIIKYRKEKGYSQESMAHFLDIAQPTYYKIETGRTELSLRRLYQIASALSVGIEYLLGLDAKHPVPQINDCAVCIQNIDNQYDHTIEAYEKDTSSLKEEIAYWIEKQGL